MKKEKDSAVNNGRLVGNKRMNNPENRDLRRETVLEVHTGSCVGSVIFIVGKQNSKSQREFMTTLIKCEAQFAASFWLGEFWLERQNLQLRISAKKRKHSADPTHQNR